MEYTLISESSPAGWLQNDLQTPYGSTPALLKRRAHNRGDARGADRLRRASDNRFKLLVESVTDYAIYTLDPEGRITNWSVGAERSEGYKAKEVLGRNFSMFFLPEAVKAAVPAQVLAAAALDGRYEKEDWRLRKDGRKFWALVTLTAIRGSKGELRGFAKITRDMTAQKLHDESLALAAIDIEKRVERRARQLEETVAELRASNKEKEVLLREVYHRVKNNLQVVQSMLKTRARSLENVEARRVIETSVQRIHVMAMAHERLYNMPGVTGLSISTYLRDVISGAIKSNSEQPETIDFKLDSEEIPLTLDTAIPFGLMANEILTNCLKHGIPTGQPGNIHVSVRRIPGAVRLVVKDNGVGLPAGFDPAKSTSMGLKLAISLAHQLGGHLKFTSDYGCQVQADLTRLDQHVERREKLVVSEV